MKVLVGSENPVKINAVKKAFSKYFDGVEVIGIKVKSGVPDQPINEETFDGAKNRALELKKINEEKNLGAKFFVGIEGGIMKIYSRWFSFGAMCIVGENGGMGFGTSPLFELPEDIISELLNRVELGKVMDKITGEKDVKRKGGAIEFFTKGVMDRTELYVHGLVTALIPFINEKMFFKED
ncbi:MAG: inosine/xanthosine triphosphatase [Candidatus Aenigmarchaeota archaeon]|nr:inosine/xanthosine triphosphatase [Candidatus Aenigmarchaeota archaeon]